MRRHAARESGTAIAPYAPEYPDPVRVLRRVGCREKSVHRLLRNHGVLRSHREAAQIWAMTRPVHEIMSAELAE